MASASSDPLQAQITGGKFTLLMIGPSQHGKTTFLSELIGATKENGKALIGTGLESVTKDLEIYYQKSLLTGIEVRVIDSPGLNDSRDSVSNEPIKTQIRDFLAKADNKPNCVLLIYKFNSELTAYFVESVKFGKEIAEKYHCPILLVHSYSDSAGHESTYPSEFAKKIIESPKGIQATAGKDEAEGDRMLIAEYFAAWKAERENKIKALLGNGIPFHACCFGKKQRGKVILPDGTEVNESSLLGLKNAVSTSLLYMAVEFGNQKAKSQALELISALGIVLLSTVVAIIIS